MARLSVAMTADVDAQLRSRLLRPDGQEDVCLATYERSTGHTRSTLIVSEVLPPRQGERHVHGNATFTGDYVLRAAAEAAVRGRGLVLLHSHPGARGWQGLSSPDHQTEATYARVATTFTDLPLLGMTLGGGDLTWSARTWTATSGPQWAETVRVVGETLRSSFNPQLMPPPPTTGSQVTTVSAWGPAAQANMARLRVLVVGLGSVGLDVAQKLAASGICELGLMDFDAVEFKNLDRMVGATREDAASGRSKAAVATRLSRQAATAVKFRVNEHETSITDPVGIAEALDYDVIFSCVDRPWARAVLNEIAYTDLIPVIDGGVDISNFPDGSFRSATIRHHALTPGRPCMVCTRQLEPGKVTMDQLGLLDDPTYLQAARLEPDAGQNVVMLSAQVSAGLLAQFVSLTVAPAGIGVPAPLRYSFALHTLEHLDSVTSPYCYYEISTGVGDKRIELAKRQDGWREIVARRAQSQAVTDAAPTSRIASLLRRLAAWFDRPPAR